VAEVPVRWRDVEGSKLNVIDASTSMLRDMLLLRVLYGLGLWTQADRRLWN
jgi:dolichyl-phosphate beta-glucosyltransferase